MSWPLLLPSSMSHPELGRLVTHHQAGAGASTSGQEEAQTQLLEGQLSWLVHIVGAVIRGRNSSSSGESQVGWPGRSSAGADIVLPASRCLHLLGAPCGTLQIILLAAASGPYWTHPVSVIWLRAHDCIQRHPLRAGKGISLPALPVLTTAATLALVCRRP